MLLYRKAQIIAADGLSTIETLREGLSLIEEAIIKK